MTLRDYQQSAVDAAIAWCKYKDTPAIVDIATGGGKTHIINALVERFYKLGQRVCVLAHRKELLEQSGDKISVPFGYYSASVGEKNIESQVIIAGIQSIYNKSEEFKPFDIIICDECHHIPNNDELGRYWKFINNHQCKLIGLTATPFRTLSGKLGWGDVVYEAKYPLLLELGHLTPITNKVKDTPDLSGVKLVAGEYNESQLSHVMESPELIEAAIKNIIAYSQDRHSILIFCVSVAHARLLSEAMQANGLQSGLVHGGTPKAEREQILSDFRCGRLRHLLNCEILLEGFDAPNIDMIACLRPTKSKGLWEQLLGRGVRKEEGKQNCFVLDMAGNFSEHGGLGTPYYEKARGESEKPKGRICPECESFNKPTARECADCGFQFPEPESPKASHNSYADTESHAVFQPLVRYDVRDVIYREHTNRKNGNISIRVDYACNANYGAISEWYSPYSDNDWARNKCWQFFKDRGWDAYGDIKEYKMEDLLWHAATLKKPVSILVDHNEKFARITTYEWAEESTQTAESNGVSDSAASNTLGEDAIPDFWD